MVRPLTWSYLQKKMKLEVAIWNSRKTRVIGVADFNSVKELQDFMTELQKVEKEATYTITSVRKDK